MTRVRVLIAPDKFKGCLDAAQVADAVASGFPPERFDVRRMPLADGGDGSVAAAAFRGARTLALVVTGPTGEPVRTAVAIDGDTAIIEVASICGLAMLGGELAPLASSSFGVGEAIRHVIEQVRPRKIVLALGGSATTDGGAGMLAALGARFTMRGPCSRPTGGTLREIEGIDLSRIVSLGDIELVAACDVRNPLLGPSGAAATFGPQKGASPLEVAALERGLQALVRALPETCRAASRAEGSGSAGGLGFACLVLGGRIVSGADLFLDLLGFDAEAAHAAVVITGEGAFDAQTAKGKLVSAVARRSSPPVVVVAGRSLVSDAHARRMGVHSVYALSEMTHRTTADDPELSAALLSCVGESIARSIQQPRPQCL